MTARYVAGRVGQALLVLWAAYTLSFLLLGALPGDGILIKFENPELGLSADQVAAIREYYRVDDPLLLQYVHALAGTLQGDLGYSVETATPVLDRISAAVPATLQLASLAFVVAAAIAVVLALALAATFARSPWLHNTITAVPSLLVSVPAFWLGIVLLQVFSFRLGWVPVIGAEGWQELVLPVLTLAVPVSAPLAQIVLRTLDDVATRPFVHVVEAKGASRWWTLSRHTARNSLLPVLTISGLLVAELIAGSVVTESVFGRDGLGRLTNLAVAAQDLPVIQAIVLVAALAFVTVNLAVDLLYPVLDPRLRRARTTTAPPSAVVAAPAVVNLLEGART
ncbi:ABC transporter permease [Georgenia satyanarayanai]|uniref:ABC transporter permease n=1 Tax=Georgenia satyanarayanai TaxID=860221 RepID=UPI00203D2FB0|nr:ABC transporter permease [Georgenia satyanarayanai]MCM3660965.1 ABC transporter permease [Georgenia satyanarayanai]